MQSVPQYARAPIIEAILDFRVALPEGVTADSIAAMSDRIQAGYPTIEPLLTSAITIQLDPAMQVEGTQQQGGYRYRSQDGLRVVQATTSGFTHNQLRPYNNWASFRDEARRLWEVYRDICNPTQITRVGLRYINRLEMPASTRDFKDYLRTVPEVASELDTGLNAFFMQLQLAQQDLDCMLIINETTAPQTDPGIVPVILDIDVARQHDWSSDDESIWQYLDQLRDRKNTAFEASITDAARRLFD